MGSVIFAEGILWGVKATDKYGVKENGEILTDGSGSGLPRIRVNGSMYNTGLKAGKVLRDANGRIKTSGYSENYREQQIWRVRKDWNTGDLTVDASILRDIAVADVTEAMIAADKAQYEKDWNNWPADEGAPYDDVDGDGVYTPGTWNEETGSWSGDIPGIPGSDQTVWTVANDLPDEYAEGGVVSVSEDGWGSPPVGFEMQLTLWGYDFPFYYVQIAPFPEQGNIGVREAQRKTLESTKNTGMAVLMDIGEEDDIHPHNKQDVGKRLALLALDKQYDFNYISSGPKYKSHQAKGRYLYVDFDSVGSGLDFIGGKNGFEIAGKDNQFYPATAKIINNRIRLYSKNVKRPINVRYGWKNWTVGTLFNKQGLPASSFSSEL